MKFEWTPEHITNVMKIVDQEMIAINEYGAIDMNDIQSKYIKQIRDKKIDDLLGPDIS